MSSELISVLEGLAHDRGVDKDTLIALVEEAIATALTREVKSQVKVCINRKNGEMRAWSVRNIVETVTDPALEITLADAARLQPGAELGGELREEIPSAKLSRIAAQTCGQVIRQKLRQAEKQRICEDFEDKVGQLLSGTVRRIEHGDVYIDFGRAEGCMERKERLVGEEYHPGDHTTVQLVKINALESGPSLYVSRATPDFIRRMFEREVSEIATGMVEIKAIAREPGSRTKIAVAATSPKVDPVGACVGVRGNRVRVILQELNGEKVDIVPWDASPARYVANALQPAKLVGVKVDEEKKQVYVSAGEGQLSLAIGKRGQNARLASRLTGWNINIAKVEETTGEETFEAKMHQATDALAAVAGIERQEAEILVKNGFVTIAGILAGDVADLAALEGIGAERAEAIMNAARQYAER